MPTVSGDRHMPGVAQNESSSVLHPNATRNGSLTATMMPSFQLVVRKQTMLAISEPSMISAAALASMLDGGAPRKSVAAFSESWFVTGNLDLRDEFRTSFGDLRERF